MPYVTRLTAVGAVVLLGLALVLVAVVTSMSTLAITLVAVPALVAAVYVVWSTEPHYTFTAAVMLSPFSGNWQHVGLPGFASPDRLLVIGGILTVLLRGPAIVDPPRLRFGAAHWALALTAGYAVGSALVAGTLFQNASGLKLLQAYGVLPFLVFTLAPIVFPTARERSTLLTGLVVLGAYLSLTTLFEMAGPKSLVFPRYILDPTVGIHAGRGRGPFVDAVANGFALYACAVASLIAVRLWRRRTLRVLAGGVAILCVVGTLLTLERSIWIGTAVASIVALLASPATRRLLIPVVVVAAASILAALVLIPDLSSRVQAQANNQYSAWDRLNTDRAALNMIKARPMFGFGWSRYLDNNIDYFQQSSNYPLAPGDAQINLHSVVLTYAVELGLVGATLWILAVLLGVGGALLARGPPDLEPWRAGLLAVFVFFAISENFVPPTVFQSLCLWLWAGVVWAGRYQVVARRVA